ncbi:methyltransferase domain-containing protein [Alistipes provencensis]|uniref:methyltransferase domain-containing protein n=1 Tax=Alistipes provencensis TaxID=1816676 RepID=UPI001950F94C|nr:methyltransferase domain-containing protein [Alistipes provencensis]
MSQYLTPDRTARQMAALAVRYFDNDSRIVDACCGTGQLTRALIAEGVHPSAIIGFDMDGDMIAIYERLYPTVDAMQMRFEDIDFRGENIIANPPFETAECIFFFDWLTKVQRSGDYAVLLLPHGFIDKQRPKTVQETIRHFIIHHRAPMQELFLRTNCRAEIVVLERL